MPAATKNTGTILTALTKIMLLTLTLVISSCSFKAGSDYSVKTTKDLLEVPSWSATAESSQASSLFSLLESKQLQELVQEAITANPGLKQTRLSLHILLAELRQTKADRVPQANADLSGSDEEGGNESYSGSLTVSWTLDIWGKLADEIDSAKMDVAGQASLVQAARDTLAAEVMKEWLQLISANHAVQIQESRLETFVLNETFILERYRNGLGELEDLDSARSSTSSARATLEEYKETVNRLQRTLRTLLGQTAKSAIEVPTEYPVVLVPLSEIPAQTLARRPDLKAAYYAIVAEDLDASVAYKELLPSINLSAALTDIGESPGSLLLSDPIWSLLGQLTAPLFQGGSLKAAAEAADLRAAKSYQEYRETLLDAVQEVEDGIGYERELGLRIAHITSALLNARSSLASYRQSYRTGLVDILDLLTVQEKTYDLEIQLDNLIYEQLANRINLGLALGLGVTEQCDV